MLKGHTTMAPFVEPIATPTPIVVAGIITGRFVFLMG